MEVNVIPGPEFVRNFKRLSKKHRSLIDDLVALKEEMVANPLMGTDLGNGVRKIRMAISDKGKGKSGGARIITLNVLVKQEPEDVLNITLLTIYDKSEISNLSDSFISYLVDNILKNDNPMGE